MWKESAQAIVRSILPSIRKEWQTVEKFRSGYIGVPFCEDTDGNQYDGAEVAIEEGDVSDSPNSRELAIAIRRDNGDTLASVRLDEAGVKALVDAGMAWLNEGDA